MSSSLIAVIIKLISLAMGVRKLEENYCLFESVGSTTLGKT